MSLPCVGYVQDMESALSRIGECQRVGCNLSFLYFFEKLHTYLVAKSYSILPNMQNNMNRDIKTLLNTPIQLFGIPDVFPIFSLYTRGNANNYRLYNYGSVSSKNMVIFLYLKGKACMQVQDYEAENNEYRYSLYGPNFSYEAKNKTINKLKTTINITPEEIREYWKNNISYKLMKPKNYEKTIGWIKCMFFLIRVSLKPTQNHLEHLCV